MVELIIVIVLAVLLAWAAFQFLPAPASWLLAGLVLVLAIIYLFTGLDLSTESDLD